MSIAIGSNSSILNGIMSMYGLSGTGYTSQASYPQYSNYYTTQQNQYQATQCNYGMNYFMLYFMQMIQQIIMQMFGGIFTQPQYPTATYQGAVDLNNDGSISTQENTAFLEYADADNDNQISQTESDRANAALKYSNVALNDLNKIYQNNNIDSNLTLIRLNQYQSDRQKIMDEAVALSKLDTDSDGKVSVDELAKDNQYKNYAKDVDCNNDGYITAEEVLAYKNFVDTSRDKTLSDAEKLTAHNKLTYSTFGKTERGLAYSAITNPDMSIDYIIPKGDVASASTAIAAADKNKDGKVTIAEFQSVAKYGTFAKYMDADKDGNINAEEYIGLLNYIDTNNDKTYSTTEINTAKKAVLTAAGQEALLDKINDKNIAI